jgi:ABC-type nitrate/sulfonate/bicarbonate transport system substrate-binding protein
MWLSAASVITAGRRRSARRFGPLAVIIAGLSPLLLVTGCDPFAAHPSDQLVTVAAVPGIENANLYLAQHSGYFTGAGIKVKIVHYTSVSDEISALNNGSIDVIAADYGDMFYQESIAANPIYELLADGYDAAPGVTEIMTMPGSAVKNPEDLAGQTIPVPESQQINAPQGDPTTLALASTVSVLQSDGVNLAAVNWRPMPVDEEISELTSGAAKAILVSGIGVYEAQQKGAVELIDGDSGPTSGIPLDGFFTTTGWVSESKNAQAAKDFRTAIYNADAAAAMPGPIQSVLPAYLGIKKQEADLIATGTYPLSTITSNLQRTALLMENEGMTALQVNVADLVDPKQKKG